MEGANVSERKLDHRSPDESDSRALAGGQDGLRFQQSLSAAFLSGLAPWACWAAVGSPCICLCVSCDEVATSPVARFILSVGGCSLGSAAVPVVWPDPIDAGPEPASFRFAARPEVSQGPAIAVLTPGMSVAQPARTNRFVFILLPLCPDAHPSVRAVRAIDAESASSGWSG